MRAKGLSGLQNVDAAVALFRGPFLSDFCAKTLSSDRSVS